MKKSTHNKNDRIIKTFCTDEPITSITFNENGQILAAGGLNGGLMIYDLRKI
jgi:WD40 repeat protein